jgi:hypothetical protein
LQILAVEVATVEQPIDVSARTHGRFELKLKGTTLSAPELHQNDTLSALFIALFGHRLKTVHG